MQHRSMRVNTARAGLRERWLPWLGALLVGVALVMCGRAQAGDYVKLSDTVELYYEEAGEGTPIVFIPGWTMTTEMFARQMEHFSKSYRAITFDPRGQGRSSKTLEGNTYAQHARDLRALMTALELEDVVLVSWSWGVMEHLSYVRQFGTEGLAASVFVDGAPKSLVEGKGDWGDGTLMEVVYFPRSAQEDRVQMTRDFTVWMLEDASDPEVLAWIEDESLRTPSYVATLLGYDAIVSNYTEELKSLDGELPVLQVLREDWSEAATRWLERQTPEAEVFVLGKHMMFWERADRFNTRLDRFLNAVFAPELEPEPQPTALVRDIQRGLNALGYGVGPADGLLGPGTKDAIRRYEADQRLLVTGLASEPLVRHIRNTIRARDAAAAEEAAQQEPAGPPADLVKSVQSELTKRGYDVRSTSGELDERTVLAIRAYQADQGLLVDGQVSEALLQHIEASPAGLAAGMSRSQQVRYVQDALNQRGFDAGPADGAMGRRTGGAIREYQTEARILVTGEVTPGLIERLSTEPLPEPPPEPESPPETAEPAQPAGPKLVTRLYDDFSDGNYDRDPVWKVRSGRFQVENNNYLRTYVAMPTSGATAGGQQSVEDLGKALLKGVLESALGGGQQVAPAQISTAVVSLKNVFRLEIELSSQLAGGQLLFGPYQGGKARRGYRLAYSSGSSPSLSLLAVTKKGTQVVASADRPVAFEDGGGHIVEWSRAADGEMTVIVDGQTVITTRDNAFTGAFAGFTIVNTRGDFAVNTVQIDQPE